MDNFTIYDWPDAMLDLETLGTNPGDAVISIGIQLFDAEAGKLGPGAKVNLDIEKVIAAGFGVTGSTIKFWINQSEAATKAALESPSDLVQGLMAVADLLTDDEGGQNESLKVWGNGVGFDNVLLREMYQRLNLLEPWMHWNDRCFRTMKGEHDPDKKLQPEFVGEKHDALADATHQAKWLINIKAGKRVFGSEQAEPDLSDEASYLGHHGRTE
jgi:hypothetical protein